MRSASSHEVQCGSARKEPFANWMEGGNFKRGQIVLLNFFATSSDVLNVSGREV